MRGAAAEQRPEAEVPPALRGRSVGDAMVHRPKVFDERVRVAELREFFADDHVHGALVVGAGDRLLAVVERPDLDGSPGEAMADRLGRLTGRTVHPDADLVEVWWAMREQGRRRLAVVDPLASTLLGLLCLKASGQGFCSDADVEARRLGGEGCG